MKDQLLATFNNDAVIVDESFIWKYKTASCKTTTSLTFSPPDCKSARSFYSPLALFLSSRHLSLLFLFTFYVLPSFCIVSVPLLMTFKLALLNNPLQHKCHRTSVKFYWRPSFIMQTAIQTAESAGRSNMFCFSGKSVKIYIYIICPNGNILETSK